MGRTTATGERSTTHCRDGVEPTLLPDDLRQLVDAARLVQAKGRDIEVEYAFCLAEIARAATSRKVVRGNGNGTFSAIEACARALGIERQTLQPYALLVSRWTVDELRVLFNRRTVSGRRLSISHLIVLSRLARAERDAWSSRVLCEGLEAHQLRSLLRKSEGRDAGGGAIDATGRRRESRTQLRALRATSDEADKDDKDDGEAP